jgi:hypothetical protein
MERALIAAAWAGDRVGGLRPGAPVSLLPPTETGKPLLPLPSPLGQGQAEVCASPLPCGARLYGATGKSGAVEVQIPALRW